MCVPNKQQYFVLNWLEFNLDKIKIKLYKQNNSMQTSVLTGTEETRGTDKKNMIRFRGHEYVFGNDGVPRVCVKIYMQI